jgi:hypothetical protein
LLGARVIRLWRPVGVSSLFILIGYPEPTTSDGAGAKRFGMTMTTMVTLERVSVLLDEVMQLSLGHPDRLRLLTIAEQSAGIATGQSAKAVL